LPKKLQESAAFRWTVEKFAGGANFRVSIPAFRGGGLLPALGNQSPLTAAAGWETALPTPLQRKGFSLFRSRRKSLFRSIPSRLRRCVHHIVYSNQLLGINVQKSMIFLLP